MAECFDCSKIVYRDYNMVMVKDDIWNQIIGKNKEEIVLCDECMCGRMGRPITNLDLKMSNSTNHGWIPCNLFWLNNKLGVDIKKTLGISESSIPGVKLIITGYSAIKKFN